MTSERLTRTELTWLLAQEARTAAQKLRQGVGMSPSSEAILPPPAEEISGGVEGTLARLDEAVSMLASLHGHPATRGRRGKIDLAALLWEVAPEARVSLEPGEGTTVFGDEAELRRMLHVLISHSGEPSKGGALAIQVKRDGDDIRVAVALGPDFASATYETERAWLARMATRYGGRVELDGSMQTLVLAADVDTNKRELESLKKELAAAQAQGEAYARELAAVFTRPELTPAPGFVASEPPGRLVASSSIPSRASHMPTGGDGLNVLVAGVRAIGAELRGILSAIGRDITPLRDREGEAGEIASSVARHVTAASEIVSDLARIGACPIGELPRVANVAEILRDVAQADLVRAARHDVRIVVEAPENVEEVVSIGAFTVLLHALLDHAIGASPAGSQIDVTLAETDLGSTIMFDDAGPPLPAPARTGVLSREFEVIAHGRSSGLSLVAATSIAANLRLPLEFEDAPRGGTRAKLTIARTP